MMLTYFDKYIYKTQGPEHNYMMVVNIRYILVLIYLDLQLANLNSLQLVISDADDSSTKEQEQHHTEGQLGRD